MQVPLCVSDAHRTRARGPVRSKETKPFKYSLMPSAVPYCWANDLVLDCEAVPHTSRTEYRGQRALEDMMPSVVPYCWANNLLLDCEAVTPHFAHGGQRAL